MFSGSIPALVTPFRDGTIDEAAFRAFVDWQIADGSSALVPCGTTGESATMTVEEHNRVIAICVGPALDLRDQPRVEHSPNRGVHRARRQVHFPAGARANVLDDGVTVQGPVAERQQDLVDRYG